MQQHGDFVARVAARLAPSPDDAQDAAQEVFIRLWRRPPLWVGRGKLTTYLYRMVRNVCRELRRRAASQPLRFDDVYNPSPSSDTGETGVDPSVLPDAVESLDASQRRALVGRWLQALPERQREVAVLRLFEGHDLATAARLMGCREPTAKTHLARALDALKQRAARLDAPASSHGESPSTVPIAPPQEAT